MIYAVLILISILAAYAGGNYMLYTLPLVEAGPIFGVKRTGLRKIDGRIKAVYKKVVDEITYKYRRFVVQGICMKKIGINPNDVVCVQMFASEEQKQNLQKGTPVLIFLNDKKFRGYKIRIIKKLVGDEAETFYYNEDGSEHPSSENHTLKSIVGIVDLEESGIAA